MRIFLRKIIVGSLVIGVTSVQLGAMNKADAGVYSLAKRYLGLHERKHTNKLQRAVGVNPRSTPWCGAFVGAILQQAGKPIPAGHLRAANWKKYGTGVSLKGARKGDIVVVRTSYGNHVGFYAGQKNGKVQLLGGNQSNSVKLSSYAIRSVQSVRRAGGAAFNKLSEKGKDASRGMRSLQERLATAKKSTKDKKLSAKTKVNAKQKPIKPKKKKADGNTVAEKNKAKFKERMAENRKRAAEMRSSFKQKMETRKKKKNKVSSTVRPAKAQG